MTRDEGGPDARLSPIPSVPLRVTLLLTIVARCSGSLVAIDAAVGATSGAIECSTCAYTRPSRMSPDRFLTRVLLPSCGRQ